MIKLIYVLMTGFVVCFEKNSKKENKVSTKNQSHHDYINVVNKHKDL